MDGGLYKNVGVHAEDLADGQMVGPGEQVELTEEQVRDPRVEDLITIGTLIGLDDKGEHEAGLAARRQRSRETREAGKEGEEET